MTTPADRAVGRPVRPRATMAPASTVVLVLAALLGLAAFTWPLWIEPTSPVAGTSQAPLLFALLLVVVLALVLTQLSAGGINVTGVALLGVLAAVGSVLRALGAGIAGIQPMFFLLVLGGRVFGPGFGFVLGTVTMATSALLTGGVGPWLPFQMIAAGFLGLGAGLLPRARGRAEIALLAAYGFVAAYLYGVAMNLSFWPFALGVDTGLSYTAGAGTLQNLGAFAAFTLATSAAFDLGRAVTTTVLVLVAGPAVLRILRRWSRQARFDHVG